MHVQRIGFTPLKGGRHAEHEYVDLVADGPVGDRVFCLVDPARERVLRTVENPSLLQATANWTADVLSVDLAGRIVEGQPAPTGEQLKVDYWGRRAQLEVVAGPWADAYSAHLGFDVILARSLTAGEVVYGAPVSLVSTASLEELGRRIGRKVDGTRFRPTFVVEADVEEDSWVGRDLVIGDARITVRSVLPRCAVVDMNPETGTRDAPVLQTLGGYRRSDGEIDFGVDAVVSAAGRVRHGDAVSPADEG